MAGDRATPWRSSARQPPRRDILLAPAFLLVCGLAGAAIWLGMWPPRGEAVTATTFAMCNRPPHWNCVIDGDTFYFRDQSIRIADIDAPETHPPRCVHEAALGTRATRRLRELLNAGPFELRGDREDQYGRELRTVYRDGKSLGGILVTEGVARRWAGRREPWCG